MRKPKPYYKRKLPHIQPMDGEFFVTFNLKGAIPKKKLAELKLKYEMELEKLENGGEMEKELQYVEWKKYFSNVDKFLDKAQNGNHYLKNTKAAQIVIDQLNRFDKEFYDLKCYCVMSNHVHVLFDCEPYQKLRLDQIMKRIKGASARYLNDLLKLSGQFWERESFDHLVRNQGESLRIEKYILDNPVKAGVEPKFIWVKNRRS